jgi:spectinomycin phosphotransferase
MLDKPDFPDDKIIACLQAEYGLPIVQFTFLPLGVDLSTAVYQAITHDETAYFCKLKRGPFNDISVEIPKFLSEQGISQIIPPLTTKAGRLRAELDEFNLILYPFVTGTSGYEVALTEPQWADFGLALKRIHTAVIPPTLITHIEKETFAPEWRQKCRQIIARLDEETFADPVTIQLADLLRSHRPLILDLIARAEQLAQVMVSRSLAFVLCHSDIHPGNLLIDTQGNLFIVDWDYPVLAPKERDLMFVGGGQGFVGCTAQTEERLFYRSYLPAQVDPIALAYYRYERNVIDIAVAYEQILSSKQDGEDRAQVLEYLKYSFLPDCHIDIAYKSDQTRNLS